MTHYVDADASGNIRAILNDAIDTIPVTAQAITPAQVDEWNGARGPQRWTGTGFALDTVRVTARQRERLLAQFDAQIRRKGERAALVQLAFVVAELVDLVDISSLPAPRRARMAAVALRLKTLGAAFQAKKKAERDMDTGTDPDTISVPAVDDLDF